MKLTDKVARITGTSPNLGAGIAEVLAAEGAAIVAIDANPAGARDCGAYINKNGTRAIAVTCNVTDESQVKAAVDTAVKEFGKGDVLVINAAFFNKKGVLDMPFDEWTSRPA